MLPSTGYIKTFDLKEENNMNDIIEHYGKVVVALAGVLAAVLLTVAVVGIVNTKTTTAVENISYEKQITDAIEGAGND